MFNEDKTVAAAQKVMLEILVENRRILIETFVKGRNVDFDFDFA